MYPMNFQARLRLAWATCVNDVHATLRTNDTYIHAYISTYYTCKRTDDTYIYIFTNVKALDEKHKT